MASIRKRGDKWEARVSRKGFPPISKSFTLRADAERFGRHTEAAMERGEFQEQPLQHDALLRELLVRYRLDITPAKKGAAQEAIRLKWWEKQAIAKLPIYRIKPADIAKERDTRLAYGASSATVRLELAALSNVFRHAAYEWGFEGLSNPCMAIKRPPPGKSRSRRLVAGELDAVLAATRSRLLPSVAHFAIETASRLGEIVSLQWKHIDLAGKIATYQDTKNGDRRTIPLSAEAIDILVKQPRRADDGTVFCIHTHSITVAWISAVRNARKAYEEACKAKDVSPDEGYLQDLRFHDLRHEAVSRLFEKGLDATEVKSISGHRTMAMLARYTHHDAKRLAEKLSVRT